MPSLGRLEDGLGQLEDGLGQLEDGLGRLKDGLGRLEDGLSQGRAYRENCGRNVTRNVIVEKRLCLLSNVFQKKTLRINCVSLLMHRILFLRDMRI